MQHLKTIKHKKNCELLKNSKLKKQVILTENRFSEFNKDLCKARIAQIDNVSILHPTFLVKKELKMY